MAQVSRFSFVSSITRLAEAKYIFTFLALLLLLVLLILHLDSYSRRHLASLESQIETLNKQASLLEETIKELRNERQRREVVLRKEVGKAREEIVALKDEMGECKEDFRKEGILDRCVDMEEKVCLIRRLEEIAKAKGIEFDDGGLVEKFEGELEELGVDRPRLDEEDGVSIASKEEERESEIEGAASATWDRFEETFKSEHGEGTQEMNQNDGVLEGSEEKIAMEEAVPQVREEERQFPLVPPLAPRTSLKRSGCSSTGSSVAARPQSIHELE
ncbi:hypothetical protein EG329_009931 [Mollisiaceae sp. DMI_Dod_QoI]|nr:hypothetical protein EG329_009931 [Helotiales sp. DMI_Dod_QoI]